MNKLTIDYLQSSLLDYYSSFARDLPWRKTKDPYKIWVSEIMLQQTQVKTVIPYYERFISKLPTVLALASAHEDELLKLWEGLGYYSRVLNMHKAAKMVVKELNGMMPHTSKDLLKLPGIGLYTAGAIASIAFEERISAVDGNVHRVLSRYFGLSLTKEALVPLMDEILPSKRIGDFNQAIMEIGALICLPSLNPNCQSCPLKDNCVALDMNLIDSLPLKPKKLIRTKELYTLLMITDDASYYLQKRPAKGLLANLWEFPLLKGHLSQTEIINYVQSLGLKMLKMMELPNTSHAFTHKDWDIIAYKVTIINPQPLNDFTLVLKDDLLKNYTLSSLFNKYQEYYR